MSTESIWTSVGGPNYPALAKDLDVDVCIIGAGIAGLSIAYQLTTGNNQSVIVVDKEKGIGGGETGRTSAHLSNILDSRYSEVVSMHGEHKSKLVAQSHAWAIQKIQDIARSERINCQFQRVPGYLVWGDEDQDHDILTHEFEAAQKLQIPVLRVNEAPLFRYPSRSALQFPNQAQFHPLAYLKGLAQAVAASGVAIYCDTLVDGVESGDICTLKTKQGPVIRAKSVVMASSSPFANTVALHTKQSAYRTFVAAYAMPARPRVKALIWDTADPFHYVRTYESDDRTMLLVGGEDYKTGHDEDSPFANLTEWALRHFDVDGEAKAMWSGQILEPVDQLAFIGRNPSDHPNVYVVSGTSGNGLTYGTIAGRLIADMIEGRENPWQEIYDPGRVTLKATGTFLSENADVAAQYADWLTPGDKSGRNEIGPSCGAILRDGASKLAVYRDPKGKLHEMSAVCPHLGCLVAWNPTEQSWDCPCHGSRFSPTGEVLNGPAVSDLEKAEKAQASGKG